jgi:hypothetical protein
VEEIVAVAAVETAAVVEVVPSLITKLLTVNASWLLC